MKTALRRKLLGSKGLSGVRLREADETDMIALRDLIQGALRKLFQIGGEDDPWPWVVALYPDSVVVERDGKLQKYPYTVAGTDVTFGAPAEVVREFVAAGEAKPAPAGATAVLIEAVGEADQNAYRVRVIRAGASTNGNFYPDAVLREAAPLFNGARVFVKSDREHLAAGGKDVRNLIGALSETAFIEGKGRDSGEIVAILTLIVGDDDPIAIRLREAVSRRLSHLFGLSIDVEGTARKGAKGIRIAEAFTKVHSVDLIVEPGAGGQVISFVEAAAEPNSGKKFMDRDALIALIQKANAALLEGKDLTTLTDEELQAILSTALKPQPQTQPEPTQPANLIEAVDARIRMRERVNATRLPAAAKQRVIDDFAQRAIFTEADITQRIKDEATYLSTAVGAGGGHVLDLGADPFIEAGEGRPEKIADMLDAFFDPKHKDHKDARSFRECYIEITGDRHVTGRAGNATRFREATGLDSAAFSSVLGDGIHRRMIADYRGAVDYDMWRLLTGEPVPATDFRTQQRTRFGGYGDLPIVAEKGAYAGLTSPTDEKAEYAVQKRGGTESITLEMIKNDDVGAIQRIPTKIARAAKRTLCKFVLDFVRTNPVIYDAKALFHVDHGNLGAAALDATSFAARRLAMVKQTEYNSADALGVGPKYLWCAPDLEETAHNLFNRSTNLDKTFVQSLVPQIVPVWYWTDANDWALSADPLDIPIIELGFLDGNEEPELFVQDSPTFGSLFSNDQVTYKLRHIYGGNALDWRGVDKSVVI